MKRRTLIALHIAVIVFTAGWWVNYAHASPTPAQVRAAVDPAFSARHASLAVLALAAAADVITTEHGLHRGCRESNPIYGAHPSLPLMIGTHALIVGAAYYGQTPAWANYTAAALFGAVALHNSSLRCGR